MRAFDMVARGQADSARVGVLVVGSDGMIVDQVERSLEAEGMSVVGVEPQDALAWLDREQADIVVLDTDGNSSDAGDLAQAIRLRSTAALLVLTGDGRSTNLARGLEMGADACLVRPFAVRVLLAQVYAFARRMGLLRQGGARHLEADGLVVDLDRREVKVNERPVNLTPTESKVLSCLILNSGRPLSYRSLVRGVWGHDCDQLEAKEILKVHIHNLRRKIEAQPDRPRFVRTVRGFGYMFERRKHDREELDRTVIDAA